ncbi:cytochrome P450 [Ketobacter alkanivorans]|uniref:Cytochrome P450 n=1 Tax=Ketobacter alkanivorans TaxID=1917421 RepID=A0A2K9LL31_9GAMM|nr:cytochrome P450 [Ketobacter alkanivorans]AUM12195.1 hypothetical protein Kalk_07130 [Ketobacter alkanivorans]
MTTHAQLPPGPKEFKFKQAMKMGLSIYDYLQQCGDEFGDAFTLNLPGMEPMVWVSRPDMVKSFFSLKPDEIDQSKLAIPIDIGDNQTGFLNNEEHAHSRKVVIPSLVSRRLHDRANVMHEIITQHIDAMKPGDQYDVPRLIGDMTLDIACYTLLGLREGEKKERYKELMLHWIQASTNNTMFLIGTLYGPSKWRNRLHKAYLKKTASGDFGTGKKGILPWSHSIELKAQLADLMRKDIHEARQTPDSGRTDLLFTVSNAHYEDGELLSEERVISESMGMLVGGHETSAATSAWYMLWLLKNPDVYKKMHDTVLASIAEEGKLDPMKITEVPYLNACLSESQRLTPSAVGTMRCLIKECKIGPLTIPANTNVLAAAYLTHRRKDIWGEDVLEYRPERWLEGKQPSPFEYYPFGGGRRACVGSNQAKQQMRIIFAELARRVEFDSPYANNDEWPGQMQVSGQTEPQGGVPVTVTKVRPASYGLPESSLQEAS